MCLLAVFHRVWDDCPVFLAANREEAFARPSLPPGEFSESNGMRWFGGIDQFAGGTWLGVNQTGLIIGLTNRNDIVATPDATSRGLLCRDLLACRSVKESVEQLKILTARNDYAGFNLLAVSREAAYVFEHGKEVREQHLSPGLHLLTNAGWNCECDSRYMRSREEFARLIDTKAELCDRVRESERLCGTPPMFIDGEKRGTVSSQIIGLTVDESSSVYEFAAGPPASNTYDSYSEQFVKLLQSPLQIEVPVHRIRLKGPWEFASADGSQSGRVTMPAEWDDLFDENVKQATFRRLFHQPTNLDAGDRVFLVFDGVGGNGEFRLNGHSAGELIESDEPQRFDVTELLVPFSELVVELHRNSETERPGGLHDVVALEIEAS